MDRSVLTSLPTDRREANERTLQAELCNAQTLVLAWGNPNGIAPVRYQQRLTEIAQILKEAQKITYTVGSHTLLGHPRHGLQWRKEMRIMRLGDSEIGRLLPRHIQSPNL